MTYQLVPLVGHGENMDKYCEGPGETPSARAASAIVTVETLVSFQTEI